MDLYAAIPFECQPSKWRSEDQAMWSELRRKATAVHVVGGQDFDVKMLHARNEYMLQRTREGKGLVVAVWNGSEKGGTASAVKRARALSLPLLFLDPTTRKIRREGW